MHFVKISPVAPEKTVIISLPTIGTETQRGKVSWLKVNQQGETGQLIKQQNTNITRTVLIPKQCYTICTRVLYCRQTPVHCCEVYAALLHSLFIREIYTKENLPSVKLRSEILHQLWLL